MITFVVDVWLFVMPPPDGDVGLDANNRFDFGALASFVKLNGPIEIAVVSESEGGHTEALGFIHETINFRKSVKKGIVRVCVKMDETHNYWDYSMLNY